MNRPERSRFSQRFGPFVNGPYKVGSINNTVSYHHQMR